MDPGQSPHKTYGEFGNEIAEVFNNLKANGLPSTKEQDQARWAPNPESFDRNPVHLINVNELEAMHAAVLPDIEAPELSDETKEDLPVLDPLLSPDGFADIFVKAIHKESTPATVMPWLLPRHEVEARAAATRVVLAEAIDDKATATLPRSVSSQAMPVPAPVKPETNNSDELEDDSILHEVESYFTRNIKHGGTVYKESPRPDLETDDTEEDLYKDYAAYILPMGSKDRFRDMVTVNVEAGSTAKNLFNAAYMRVRALQPLVFAKKGSENPVARDGMTIYRLDERYTVDNPQSDAEAKRVAIASMDQLPAAGILERGLLLHDAMRLVETINPESAQELLADKAAIPGRAYLDLFRAMAVRRPLSIAYKTWNVEDNLFYAGLDTTAVRVLAYGTDPMDYIAASDRLQAQAHFSFGPEFLRNLQSIHDALPTAPLQEAFIKEVAEEMDKDYKGKNPHFDPARDIQVIAPKMIGPTEEEVASDPTFTESYAKIAEHNYTLPYQNVAYYIENRLEELNEAASKAFISRIPKIRMILPPVAPIDFTEVD